MGLLLLLPTLAGCGASGPRMLISRDTFDYGDVKYGSTLKTVFTIRNAGGEPLQILETPRIEVVEGC